MPDAAEISSNEKPSASLSTRTRAWASGSPASPSRRSARSSDSSASRSGVRPGATRESSSSGSWRRARARCDVAARVERQPVEPRRERRLAAELADLHAELRERVLRRVARILGVPEDMRGETRDTRLVARAQRLEGEWVSVLGAFHENGIAQSVVRELRLGPQCGTDSTPRAQSGLHPASLLGGGGSSAPVRAGGTPSCCRRGHARRPRST